MTESPIECPTEAPIVRLGHYRHYKGGLYEVVACGRHAETEETLVFYRDNEKGLWWARPADMFLEEINLDGQQRPRFTFLGD